MSLYEYQAKEFLRGFGVPVPRGICCLTSDDAVSIATSLGGEAWVIKRQTSPQTRHTHDPFRVARNLKEVHRFSNEMLGDEGISGRYIKDDRNVRCLLVEELVPVLQEYFIAMTRESLTKQPELIASSIRRTKSDATNSPQVGFMVERINPEIGLTHTIAIRLATEIGIPAGSIPQAIAALRGFYGCYLKTDVLHAIIDPLVLGTDGTIKALNVHFDCSDNGGNFIHDILLNRKPPPRQPMPMAL